MIPINSLLDTNEKERVISLEQILHGKLYSDYSIYSHRLSNSIALWFNKV